MKIVGKCVIFLIGVNLFVLIGLLGCKIFIKKYLSKFILLLSVILYSDELNYELYL